MIYEAPALTAAELAVCERIDVMKEELRNNVGTSPKRWPGLLRRSTFARAIQGSISIEGYDVTIDDAIAAAGGGKPIDADEAAWAAVSGYRTAMTYVLQLAEDPHFAYSTDLLRSLHFMMMHHDLPRNPGRWRPGAIYVRDDAKRETVYEGPDPELVAPLMGELAIALNAPSDAPSVVRAAMAHLNLVMIHPFSDGNGRMARCLQTLVLARTGTLAPVFSSIEEYLGRNTHAYYQVLSEVGAGAWHPERDARPWVRFCLTAHFRQVTTLLRRTQVIRQLWDEMEITVAALGLPERTLLALTEAAAGYRIRNASYRAVADVSDAVASRDLKLLVDNGLLLPQGEKRGRAYVSSMELRETFLRIAGARLPIPDPFTEPHPATLFLPGFDAAS